MRLANFLIKCMEIWWKQWGSFDMISKATYLIIRAKIFGPGGGSINEVSLCYLHPGFHLSLRWSSYIRLLSHNLMQPTVPLLMDFLVGGCIFVTLFQVYLQPLDNVICQDSITGRSPPSDSMSSSMCILFSLPACWGWSQLSISVFDLCHWVFASHQR